MKVGRPTLYNLKLAKEICNAISATSMSLQKLCKQHSHWPNPDTIYTWLNKHKQFADLYTQAKKAQISALVDEIIEIADDTSHDDRQTEDGDFVCNTEWIARSRLRVDTRKWLASKLVPRLYGDNILVRELADEMEEFKQHMEMKRK